MSTLYDGGGTNEALMKDTTIANVIAGIIDGVVDVDNISFIDIQLINAAAGESATLNVYEFSAETPTVASLIRTTQVVYPTTDLTVTGDLLMLGNAITTATAYLKAARRVQLSQISRSVLIGIDAESATGAKYLRYELGNGLISEGSQTTIDNLDLDIGNVGLLNSADARINPAESRVSNVAAAAGDNLSPSGAVRKDTEALPEAVADGDWVALQTDATGSLRVTDDSAHSVGTSMTSVAVDKDANAAAQELIAAPAAGHQLWIYGYELHANIAGTFQFLSAATAKTGIMPVAALGGVARDSSNPIFKCGTAEALNIKSVTCAADGIITYRDVTV
jgi:hypothetical protein